jgi:hypothetical protein
LKRDHTGFYEDAQIGRSIISSIQILYYFPEAKKKLDEDTINAIVNHNDNIFHRKIFKLSSQILEEFKEQIKQIPKLADKFKF